MAAPLKPVTIETDTITAVTTTTEVTTSTTHQVLPWFAVAYSPHKEVRSRSVLNELLGSGIEMPQPAHPLVIGLPIVKPPDWKEGTALESRSVRLSPGTNMGVPAVDWALCAAHVLVAPKIQSGIIQVFTPATLGEGNPGYYCFSQEAALKLIQLTLHEDWIDEWAVGESRPAVLNAAAFQRAELIRTKAARAAA